MFQKDYSRVTENPGLWELAQGEKTKNGKKFE
jgi:hypothetical protein